MILRLNDRHYLFSDLTKQSSEYKNNYAQFVETAKEWTRKFALSSDTPATSNANTASAIRSSIDNNIEETNEMIVVNNNKNENKHEESLQKSSKAHAKKIELNSDSDNDFFDDDDDDNDNNIRDINVNSGKEHCISPKKNDSEEDKIKEKTPTKEKKVELFQEKRDNTPPKAAESSQRKPGFSLFGKSNNKAAEQKKLSLSLRKDK